MGLEDGREPEWEEEGTRNAGHCAFLLSKADRVPERKKVGERKGFGQNKKNNTQDVVRWFYFLNPECAGRHPSPSEPHEISKGSGSF